MTARISEKALKQRIRYAKDFAAFAQDCLKIRPKEGDLEPFTLNRAQRHIHNKLEDQRKRTGKVRAIILKGRQQGCSTMIEGRFYWNTIHRKGARAFILAHEAESTKALYEMATRYHDNCPKALKPETGKSNAKELIFSKLDSGYKLGTAGNDSVGRGTTIQYFHGSEVAFWPQNNADELTKGVLQAVPDMPDTEVIYESTANGIGNFFHRQTIKAMRGDGEFQLIFVPWFWQDEYTKPVPEDVALTAEEHEFLADYSTQGLRPEHLMWRRNKIIELDTGRTDPLRAFKQEYPMNILEAFQFSGESGLIDADAVKKARRQEVSKGGVTVVGVDPSRGGDRFALIRRATRKMYGAETHTGKITLGRAVQICKKVLDNEKPHRMFIDAGGGADLVDRLHELGYENVTAVPFGGSPLDPEKYKNKRAEMWGEMNDWLCDETLDVQLPDSDELESDLLTPKCTRDSMDRLQLESKDKIKERGLPSPDLGDAAALTFAEVVYNEEDMDQSWAPDAGYFE